MPMRIGPHIDSTRSGVEALVVDEVSDGSNESTFLVANASSASSDGGSNAIKKKKKKKSSMKEDGTSSKRDEDGKSSSKRKEERKSSKRKDEGSKRRERASQMLESSSETPEEEPYSRNKKAPRDRRSSLKQRSKSGSDFPTKRRVSRRSSMTSVSSRSSNVKRRGSMDGGMALGLSPVPPRKKSIVKTESTDRPTCRKTVSFDEALNVSYENNVLSEDEVHELWFDRYHLESFRTELETLVDDITTKLKRRTEVWRKKMIRAYDVGCNAESDECIHDNNSPSYKLMVHSLKDLYKETAQLVGLEHLLADEIRFDGNRRRGRVLDLLDKLRDERERRRVMKMPLPLDDDTDNEKLFKECSEASLASRCFAHGVAVARVAAATVSPRGSDI